MFFAAVRAAAGRVAAFAAGMDKRPGYENPAVPQFSDSRIDPLFQQFLRNSILHGPILPVFQNLNTIQYD